MPAKLGVKKQPPPPPPPELPLPEKALRYAKSTIEWVYAGIPSRSQEEIDAILEICNTCEYFVAAKKTHCRECGCNCNGKNGWVNKIARKTEHCPLTPPKW